MIRMPATPETPFAFWQLLLSAPWPILRTARLHGGHDKVDGHDPLIEIDARIDRWGQPRTVTCLAAPDSPSLLPRGCY
jgi:hypothetical protein